MSANTVRADTRDAWRRVVGDALRFDRSGIVVADAARMAVGTSLPVVV